MGWQETKNVRLNCITGLSTADMCMLYVFAAHYYADPKTHEPKPLVLSIKKLSRESRMNKRSVYRVLKHLKDIGLIRQVRRGGKALRRASEWCVDWARLADARIPEDADDLEELDGDTSSPILVIDDMASSDS